MRIPQRAPEVYDLLTPPDGLNLFLKLGRLRHGVSVGGRYPHWDRLRYYAENHRPADLSLEEWWLAIKLARSQLLQEVPLVDPLGRPFRFAIVDPLPHTLHRVDLQAGGSLEMPNAIATPAHRDEYLLRSQIEEAFTSSQLEGAATTRVQAKELIRKGRPPRTRGERMVVNNYRAMRHILDLGEAALTPALVFDLQRIVTEGTLDDPSGAGRFRRSDEDIYVGSDHEDVVYHRPPPAGGLGDRLDRMCAFANGETPAGKFIHPAVRSMILHFWLAYDHPFVDGNGRTARALFYWSMLRSGYGLFQFVSISNILLKGPSRYGRAFLETETDDNDLTYFLLHHADVIRQAIDSLHAYLRRKAGEQREIQVKIREDGTLNRRQRSTLAALLADPAETMTVESHRRTFGVVTQTARTDLDGLAELGYLLKNKVGRAFEYRAAPDLPGRLGGAG